MTIFAKFKKNTDIFTIKICVSVNLLVIAFLQVLGNKKLNRK